LGGGCWGWVGVVFGVGGGVCLLCWGGCGVFGVGLNTNTPPSSITVGDALLLLSFLNTPFPPPPRLLVDLPCFCRSKNFPSCCSFFARLVEKSHLSAIHPFFHISPLLHVFFLLFFRVGVMDPPRTVETPFCLFPVYSSSGEVPPS